MIIAHAPISFLANEFIQKKKISQLNQNSQITVAILSMFFGILPDFDLFYLSVFDIPGFIHHDVLTHKPIFYILIWLLLRLSSKYISRIWGKMFAKAITLDFINIVIDTFLISTVFHLFADLLVNSIEFLYPLTNSKQYILYYIFQPNLFAGYSHTPLFGIEMIFMCIFFIYVYNRYFKSMKIVEYILKSLLILSCIYLPLSIYVYVNTYNRSYMYDENGAVNYDIDLDRIIDSMDMDVGNDGLSNIQKVNDVKLLDSVLDIVNSNKWAVGNSDTLSSRVKKKYGGFNSYRIVSQSFFNINLPIEPVLRDYSVKKGNSKTYFESYKYDDLLLGYLSSKGNLLELNLDANVQIPASKMFFLIDSDENILNMGISLEGNYLALVLEDDTHLDMHSYAYVREYYSEDISKIYIQR